MDDHIEICPACAAYDRAVREGVESLRGELILPTPGFHDRLAERLRGNEPLPDLEPPRVAPWAATAAALLVGTLALFALRDFTVLPEPVAAEVQPMVVAQPRILPGMPFVVYERIQP